MTPKPVGLDSGNHRSRIPASVVVAIVVLGLLQALDTVALWQEATSWRGLLLLSMRALLALGLLFRATFAWMLVRYVGPVGAIVNPLLNVREIFPDGGVSFGAATYFIMSSVLLLCASWVLGQSSAVSFFGVAQSSFRVRARG